MERETPAGDCVQLGRSVPDGAAVLNLIVSVIAYTNQCSKIVLIECFGRGGLIFLLHFGRNPVVLVSIADVDNDPSKKR